MTREQFDAMNDAEFVAWWTAEVERVQAQATTEFEVQQVFEAWAVADFERSN